MSLIGGLATIIGAGIGLMGNRSAAKAASQSAGIQADLIRERGQQARDMIEANKQENRGILAENAGLYEGQREEGQPGVSALRRTVSEVGELTPFQQQQLTDARRRTESSLAGGGFRGSGRARVSALRAVEGDLRNRMLDANRTRGDRAAGALANAAWNANQGMAQSRRDLVSANTGATSALASSLTREGGQLAGIEGRAGDTSANRSVADASILGNAVGDLAGALDPGLRKSRYSAGQTTSAMRSYYGS